MNREGSARVTKGGLALRIIDTRWFAAIAVLAGGVIRLPVLAYLRQFPLASDSLAYHGMALSLLHGEVFTPFYPPGVPLVLAAVYRFVGASELAGRATGLFWYLALAVLLYRVTRMAGQRRAANLAICIVAVFPAFVWHSTEPLTQLPTAVYLLSACYLSVLAWRAPTWHRLALLGTVLGVLVLTRPSSLLLAVVVPVAVSIAGRRARVAVVPLAVCALIVGAWLVKTEAMTGRFIFINDANARNLFYGNNPYTPLYKTWWFGSHGADDIGVPMAYTEMLAEIDRHPENERDREFEHIVLKHIATRPDLFVLRTANRLRVYFAFDTFTGSALRKQYGVTTPVALGAIALDAVFYCTVLLASVLFLFTRMGSQWSSEAVRIVILVLCCYSLPFWLAFSHPTYHLPILPLLLVLGASFVGQLTTEPRDVLAAFAGSRRRRYGLALTLLLLLFVQIEWIAFGISRV